MYSIGTAGYYMLNFFFNRGDLQFILYTEPHENIVLQSIGK